MKAPETIWVNRFCTVGGVEVMQADRKQITKDYNTEYRLIGECVWEPTDLDNGYNSQYQTGCAKVEGLSVAEENYLSGGGTMYCKCGNRITIEGES